MAGNLLKKLKLAELFSQLLRKEIIITPSDKWIHADRQSAGTTPANENQQFDPFDNIYLLAEEKAALSGRFDPTFFMSAAADELTHTKVLSLLSSVSLIDAQQQLQWMLKAEERKKIIARLVESGELQVALQKHLPNTDIFGQMLRRVLTRGKMLQPKQFSNTEIPVLLNVLESLQGVNIALPDIEKVRARLEITGPLHDFPALATGFIGRKLELLALHKFLSKNANEDNIQLQIMQVTGLGGAGKSTLLGKLTAEVLNSGKAVIMILDFDRPGIDILDPSWLQEEMLKQIRQQYSFMNKALQQVPKSINLKFDVLKHQIIKKGLHRKPFLLVLDTIEEVTQRYLTENLIEWIRTLAELLHPIPLRVIISGRLFDEPALFINTLPETKSRHITISSFDQVIAKEFLLQQGVNEEISDKLLETEIFPWRPLELKLVARLITEESIDVNNLLDDLKRNNRSEISDELFVGIIYRRVLQRINDPVIQAIAHPGLLLRYVTKEIITEILAPVLGLPVMNDEATGEVLKKLASFTWLAYKGEDGKIWHRKDLRRSMLHLMIKKEPALTKKIRNKSIGFFMNDHNFLNQEMRSEAIYHKLMMVNNGKEMAKFDENDLRYAYRDLGADIADLPPVARTLMIYIAKKEISVEDIHLLPAKYIKDAYTMLGKRLVKERNFLKAYELYKKRKDLGFQPIHNSWNKNTLPKDKDNKTEDNRWEIEVLFAVGAWNELRAHPDLFKPVDGEVNLLLVAEFIFPAAIIIGDKLDRNHLAWCLQKLHYTYSQGNEEEQAVTIERFTLSLYLLHAKEPLPGNSLSNILEIGKKINYTDRSVAVRRCGLLLEILGSGKPGKPVTFGLSTICLNTDWLQNLNSIPIKDTLHADKTRRLITDTQKFFTEITKNSTPSARLLIQLLQNDELETRWSDHEFEVTRLRSKVIFTLLVGFWRIFRDPCKYAIMEAYPDESSYDKLAARMQWVLPGQWAQVPRNEFLKTLQAGKEKALEPFIELIDRCWVMEGFIERALADCPDADKLNTLHKILCAFKTAMEKVILGYTG